MDQNTSALPPISEEEKARRRKVMSYGEGTILLEGFELPQAAKDLAERYVNGDITRAELSAGLIKAAC